MLIARLRFNDIAMRKLARRNIDTEEADELRRNGAVPMRNPRPRAPGSLLLIGPTDGGRMLTLVLNPDGSDPAIWHVRTAWDSTERERAAYHQRS